MKRLRDDACGNSQFKRPLGGSRGESYGQHQIPGERGGGGDGAASAAAAQKLTAGDALTYLKEVKDIFQNQKDKYSIFLDIMKDFKSQRINTTGVIARVKELFEGHNNLLLGFNTFLPKGYEITLIDEEEAPAKRAVEFDEAISFVNKIKKRFQNDDCVYKSFLDLLNMYRKDHKSITEVYHEVTALFDDHPDLLEEFTIFLPDTSATTSAAHVSIGRHSFHRQTQADKQRYRRERINGPHTECDLSVERPELDDDKLTTKLHKEQKKRAEKENRVRRSRGQDYRGPDHENNGGMNVHRLLDKKKSLQKVDDFGLNTVLPSNDDKVSLKCMFNQEFFFFEKVKERLHNPDDYQAFLKCLQIYSTEIITRKELQSMVSDLLGKYPDLMEGFSKFLERCESIDGFLAGITRKKSFWNEGHVSKLVKGENNKEQRREMDAYKENDKVKEKYWNKSIQELDLSNSERCTPSYRLLPPDYPIPSASQRSELGAQVLNDHWVSVTSGSEDYSFTHMRRNQYEESLFRCEDDRFELDMLLESVSSAAKHAEELLNRINDKSISPDSSIHIEDHFTVLNLRCIERVYGEHGLDVMDVLRKNPSLALPVILTRLKQKQEAWSKSRLDFDMVWAEIYAKNHYKSLDHRSFYFKQQDSKDLSTKFLVAEINEMKQKKLKEDNMHLNIAAGSTHPIVPNLEFEYSDTNIHEDLFKLIKYSCEEACTTKEQFNKVMSLWTTFLEPMLGVPSQAHSSEDTEYVMSKQSKSICNGEQTTSPDQVDSWRFSLVNGDTFSKEDGYQLEKELKKTAGADIVSGFNRTVGPCEKITTSDAALAVGADIIRCRISMETTSGHYATTSRPGNNASEDGHGVNSNIDDVPSSESGDASRSPAVAVANGGHTEGTKVDTFNKGSASPSKNEKEEGELSPDGDIEDEDNFVAYANNSYQATPNTNHIPQIMHCLPGENGANADDESENVLEAGEDVSGNESAADECLLEDHDGEEDGECIGLNGKAESKGEAGGVDNAHFVGGEGESVPSFERFLPTAKPLLKRATSALYDTGKKDSRVFYGNDTFYVVFRLHQILYERLLSAKLNSTSAETKWKTAKDAGPSDPYCRFMIALYDLLDGSADHSKFEDDCRAIIGNQSYVLFTLDKLINRLVKQLQTIASDEMDNKLLQLYDYEKSRKCEKYVDLVYYENAHVLLHDENIYRFESSSDPVHLSIQLMDYVNEKAEGVAVCVDPFFAAYLHNDFLSVDPSKKELPGIMLRRNKRKYADLDEGSTTCMAKKGVCAVNGLECNMACNSSKISYGVHTEDFFFRERRKRRHLSMDRSSPHGRTRVQRFQRFLTASV